jgi:hypothetical protein
MSTKRAHRIHHLRATQLCYRAKATVCAAILQSLSSAPGYKHGYQNQQQEDYDHCYGHTHEDQVRQACGKRQTDEWADKHHQEK